MHTHTLDAELITPGTLDEVFRFFGDPGNLAKLTPPSMGFQIVSLDRTMREGLEIEYRVRVFGLKLPWKSLITEYKPPFHFVDEALVSPYKVWRHRHSFRQTPQGIAVSDHVDYALPLWPFGEAAHFAIRAQLNGIFRYRQQALEQHLGKVVSSTGPTIV